MKEAEHYRERADAAHAELSAVKIQLDDAVRSAQSDQQVSSSLACCLPHGRDALHTLKIRV